MVGSISGIAVMGSISDQNSQFITMILKQQQIQQQANMAEQIGAQMKQVADFGNALGKSGDTKDKQNGSDTDGTNFLVNQDNTQDNNTMIS